jgi:capsular polysaccharide biosynthesis protein
MPANPHYGKIILGKWKLIALVSSLLLVLACGVSFIEPLQYSSSIRLLIIQPAALNYDPYTAIRASASVGGNLAQIVYTTDFFNRVLASKYNIDASYFPDNDAKRRKKWGQMVSVRVEQGSGLLNITVYHTDKDQATEIARAIAYVMTTEGSGYVGGSGLQIKLVDDPLVSNFPVKPNILANGFIGFVVGMFLAIGYVLLTDKSRRYLVEHPPTFV